MSDRSSRADPDGSARDQQHVPLERREILIALRPQHGGPCHEAGTPANQLSATGWPTRCPDIADGTTTNCRVGDRLGDASRDDVPAAPGPRSSACRPRRRPADRRGAGGRGRRRGRGRSGRQASTMTVAGTTNGSPSTEKPIRAQWLSRSSRSASARPSVWVSVGHDPSSSAVGELDRLDRDHDVAVLGVVMKDVVLHFLVVAEAELAVGALACDLIHTPILRSAARARQGPSTRIVGLLRDSVFWLVSTARNAGAGIAGVARRHPRLVAAHDAASARVHAASRT